MKLKASFFADLAYGCLNGGLARFKLATGRHELTKSEARLLFAHENLARAGALFALNVDDANLG